MKLSVVVSVCGQHALADKAIRLLLENRTDPNTRVVIIDNGGDFTEWDGFGEQDVYVIRPSQNIGVYPTFKMGMDATTDEVVAFFHSDLMVTERGYDDKLLSTFRMNPDLGLVGFVGSTEIDAAGGRGGGTTSNFQGNEYFLNDVDDHTLGHWAGSPASAHGRTDAGYTNAAVVDGCAMVLRRTAWEKIGYRENFPPHHFYDRLISTQMLEAGFKVAVLGIECDHISGQTVGGEKYFNFAKEWCEKNGIFGADNPDHVVYTQAEHQWLTEYRDQKHLVPIRV